MPPRPDTVWRFAARVLLWLAPMLFAWYLVAPWYDPIPTWIARGILGVYRAGLVLGVETQGRMLSVVTSIVPAHAAQQDALVTIDVNPLAYTYGLALFMALALASRAAWRRIALGAAVLLPFQAWGIAFDGVASLIRFGFADAAGLTDWRGEVAALNYQLGSLIFPTLVPVITWAALDWPFVAGLATVRQDR